MNLEQFIINECDRFITIFKPITITYVHIHKGKRIHINTKQAILAHQTIHMIKYTKNRKKGLK